MPPWVRLCSMAAMSNPWPTCGLAEGFVQSSLVFAVVKYPIGLLTICPYIVLNLIHLLQVVLSATLSRLLLLQLGFKRFQDISFTEI